MLIRIPHPFSPKKFSSKWNLRRQKQWNEIYKTFDDFETTNNFLWQDLIYLLEEIITANELLDLSRMRWKGACFRFSCSSLFLHRFSSNRTKAKKAEQIKLIIFSCVLSFLSSLFHSFYISLPHSNERWEEEIHFICCCSRQISFFVLE